MRTVRRGILRFALFGVLAIGAPFASAAAVTAGTSEVSVNQKASDESVLIYGLFLDKWLAKGSAANLGEAVDAVTDTQLADFSDCLKGLTLDRSTGAASQTLIGTTLASRNGVKLVDASRWQATDPGDLIDHGTSVDKAVEQGMDAGLLTLSAIVFDAKHKIAVFSYGFVCGRLCGNGGTVVFALTDAGWRRRDDVQCGSWMSAVDRVRFLHS